MKQLFDKVSLKTSKVTTKTYSTSFSMGIRLFQPKYHDPIYAIYGFVRFADEIVDTFHEYEKHELFEVFKGDTWKAIRDKISMNPILNSFQWVVNKYDIDHQLISQFLKSMEMDLYENAYDQDSYEEYILGSAEVVGLMCLQVFTEGDKQRYKELKPAAMRLGAAFQKINFLRDLQNDHDTLGRSYFPGVDVTQLTDAEKTLIESEIETDFKEALKGIKKLPKGARLGVYIAYVYFYQLLKKIKRTHHRKLLSERIRVPNSKKYSLLISSYIRHSFNTL